MPSYSTGVIVPSSFISNLSNAGVIIVGKLGPYTSASKIPTLAPICASVIAKFTHVVDFPTPPLQLEMAMIFFTPLNPGGASGTSAMADFGAAVMITSTSSTHSNRFTNSFESLLNSSFTGHAGVVSSSTNATSFPSSEIFNTFTKPQLTMFSPKSGSMTFFNASRTCCSFVSSDL